MCDENVARSLNRIEIGSEVSVLQPRASSPQGNFIDCLPLFFFSSRRILFLHPIFMSRVKVQRKRCSPSRIVQNSALCAVIPLRMKKQPSIIPFNVAFGLPLGSWNLGGVDNTGSINEIYWEWRMFKTGLGLD